MSKPEISIIIRTYNEERMIEKCLKAVFGQEIPIACEVIIVDSESTDKTLKVDDKFPIKIVFYWGQSKPL